MTEKRPGRVRGSCSGTSRALAGYSEDVLFGQAWKSPELSPRAAW